MDSLPRHSVGDSDHNDWSRAELFTASRMPYIVGGMRRRSTARRGESYLHLNFKSLSIDIMSQVLYLSTMYERHHLQKRSVGSTISNTGFSNDLSPV